MKRAIITTLFSTTLVLANQQYNDIKFDGLTQISKDIALETLKFTKKNSDDKKIDEAIKRFYNFGYFKDIWVTDDNKVLTFHFLEKPFIAKINMTGYKTADDDLKMLYDAMGIHKGNMYTKKRIEKAKKILLLALSQEGYINSVVEVDIEKINDTSVAVTFDVNKGDPVIIKQIKYKGLEKLSLGDIEDVVMNKEEDCCFTWFFGMNDGQMQLEQLEFDSARIKEAYYQQGFLDVKVSKAFSIIDFNTNTANVEYTIEEGEQYKVDDIIIYADKKILNTSKVYEELRLQRFDVFNVKKLRKDKNYIYTQVANKGYAYADVKFDIRKDKKTHTVKIIYNVIPNDKVYINDVIISGNSKTLDRVIRRNVYLAPKDLYSVTDYRDSIAKLRRSGFFDDVKIEKKRISKDKMNLLVTVKEAPTGSFVLGGGYGSYDGWMLNSSIKDKNIFGSGLNLGFTFEKSSKRTDFTLSLTNPAIRDSKYSGTISVYKKHSVIDEILTEDETADGDKTVDQDGISLGIGRGLTRHIRVGAVYSYDYEDVTYDINSSLDNDFTTSAITPYIRYNSTDDYFVPRRGVIAGTSLKYAGIGGDADYLLSSTYFKYFHSLERLIDYDIIFRYKNSVKLLKDTGNIPDGTTFYLGGPSSLRGYSSYAFQPESTDQPFKRFFSQSFELSFPLIPKAKMRWGLFVDQGMIGEADFTEIERKSYGELITWISPMGPIQFIFGHAIDAQEGDNTSSFEFNLGGRF